MITVNGGTRNQRKFAHSITEFVCKKFNINPTIEINFRRMTNDSNYGYACHLEDNEYEIDIKRSLPMREMLITLAHELVHVKQYEYNEMPNSIYEGDYWDRPHEIEAHGRELGLFIRWCEVSGCAGKKWANIP